MTSKRKRRNEIFNTPIDEDISLTRGKRDFKQDEEYDEEDYEDVGHRRRSRPVPDRKTLLRKQEKGKKRRRLKIFFNMIRLFLIVIVIFLIVRSPLFRIKSIEVAGVNTITESQVIDACGINVGDNAFVASNGSVADHILLKFTEAEKNILDKLPLLKNVNIRYTFLGGITIAVEESKIFGQIKILNHDVVTVDDRLMAMSVKKKYTDGLLKIKGIESDRAAIGSQLADANRENWVWTVKLIELVHTDDVSKRYKNNISMIDLSDKEVILLHLGKIHIKIGKFETMTQSKLLDILKRADNYMKQLGSDEKGTIDFTLGENAVLKK